MNAVFCMMMLVGVIAAAAQGKAGAAQAALLAGGGQAIEFCLSMAGAYAFFGGLLGVLKTSGAAASFAARLRGPMMRLFPFAPGEERALDDICMNLSADLLGMGGAATPSGLAAMRTMAEAHGQAQASGAMKLFLALNMCSVQLLPTTMIALRAQAGASNPADIVPQTMLVTGISVVTAIAVCQFMARRSKMHG